jgi:hypothetical protein
LVDGEIFLHKTAVALLKLHSKALLNCEDFEESVKELSMPIDCEEEDFLGLVDSVKVNQHWSGILERVGNNAKASPPKIRPLIEQDE